jgi:hypothetical protein
MFDRGSKREVLLEIVTVLVDAIEDGPLEMAIRAPKSEESRNRIDQAIRQAKSIIKEEGQ